MVDNDIMTTEIIKELEFNKQDLEELAKARLMPITFDEDCPEVTPEKALKFRRVNPNRQRKS